MAAAVNKSNLLMIVKVKDLPPAELEKQENKKKKKPAEINPENQKKTNKTEVANVLKQPSKSVQAKKVLPPIPERTEEEYLSARERYRREQAEIFAALPRRIPACVGQVSDNLSPDIPCKHMSPWMRGKFIKRLTARLLAESSLAIPTWEVLMNNALTIRKKVEHLQALGWEPKLMPLDKCKFSRLMVLARILEQGII